MPRISDLLPGSHHLFSVALLLLHKPSDKYGQRETLDARIDEGEGHLSLTRADAVSTASAFFLIDFFVQFRCQQK